MRHFLAAALHKMSGVTGPRRTATSLSDTQAYLQMCIEACGNYKAFNTFRRHPTYNLVLEHVSEQQGREYLESISRDPTILAAMEIFKANDAYGSPRTYHYHPVGTISPTTLRYVKVLVDLKHLFKTLDNQRICEIGAGYGGQCRVIAAYYRPATYTLVDLQPALSLAQRYLDNYLLHTVVEYRTMNELCKREYDLVISNYALTEVARAVQDMYLEKAILGSRRGYITYNEIAPAEFRCYKADEWVQMIAGARIEKEEPLTHPRNCLIVWGDNA